ncbi:MAG: IS200/IS605 family transposase [Verrucomicrobia bacterium]|nr:IS200/IS605 family transposase [Verrucomicrobiota bacterium]
MANTYSQLYVHLVWSTKERENLIDMDIQNRLYKYMGGITKSEKATLLAIGGIANHVHLLIDLPLTLSIPALVKQLKGSSSKWIHENFKGGKPFSWQVGYGAFSVSKSLVPVVENYIDRQEEHHKHTTFEEEYYALLKCHGIQFEEKYVLG